VRDSASWYAWFLGGAVFFHFSVLLSLFIMLWKNKALGDSFDLEW
jgi:hypothetical protein